MMHESNDALNSSAPWEETAERAQSPSQRNQKRRDGPIIAQKDEWRGKRRVLVPIQFQRVGGEHFSLILIVVLSAVTSDTVDHCTVQKSRRAQNISGLHIPIVEAILH